MISGTCQGTCERARDRKRKTRRAVARSRQTRAFVPKLSARLHRAVHQACERNPISQS